ncbi:MAG: GTP cyclohydrolase I FolE2, partial [Methanocorpusculum sp.]|nr:GTP cyclohydrolase I FolE2 [Methanocorpusculum sp.]
PDLPGDTNLILRQTNEESIHQHDAYAERKATLKELRDELNV